jgi:hypothetical protein
VRQEHVADLGSVAGWLLPEFWAGLDPDIAAKTKINDWDTRSIRARMAFWDQAKPRLDHLANRLDPKAFRMAVHQRIPWPKEAERELVEARQDFRLWSGLHQQTSKMIETEKELIEAANKELAELREQSARETAQLAKATQRLAKVTVSR